MSLNHRGISVFILVLALPIASGSRAAAAEMCDVTYDEKFKTEIVLPTLKKKRVLFIRFSTSKILRS